mgnify:CR=1 FL=1
MRKASASHSHNATCTCSKKLRRKFFAFRILKTAGAIRRFFYEVFAVGDLHKLVVDLDAFVYSLVLQIPLIYLQLVV